MKKEEIEDIFKKEGQAIFYNEEIEENELTDLYHNLAKSWYLNHLNLPVEIKRELIKSELIEAKGYCKTIIEKINNILKSKKFNGKGEL